MSTESDVAKVLRSDPVGRISFKIGSIAVNKAEMELVAKAIEAGDVAVEIASTGPQLGAAYSSFTGRKWAANEKKIIGKITLSSDSEVRTALGKASIFHESVHALMDVKGTKIGMQQDEVVAYLADAMYLRANKTTISGGMLEMAVFNAAFAIVDSRKMLAKPGVVLPWKDCEKLLAAIKVVPAYRLPE
jgi:hypothetical protein